MNRRKFLFSVAGVIGSLVGLRVAGLSRGFDYDWEKHSYVFVVDSTKCIGCGRCVIACKIENDVPAEFFRTWVERYGYRDGELEIDSPKGGINFPEIDLERSFFVPKLCNHCVNAPCVQACPVGATYHTREGVVLVDEDYCIGCGYCIQACPYGARYLYPSDGKVETRRNTADKCTLCYHRITKGSLPACVEVCPVGARQIFDVKDERQSAKLNEILKNASVLKPEMATKPRVFYIGIGSEVR